MDQRIPTVAAGSPSAAVSDLARSDPEYRPPTRAAAPGEPAPVPGEPFHSKRGWGATGTDGTPLPRSSTVYRSPVSAIDQAAADVIDLAPTPPPTQPEPEQPLPNATPVIPLTPEPRVTQVELPPQTVQPDRVAALENQVTNLGTLLATVSQQLQQVTAGGLASPLPGTANPMAPTHHVGSAVQRAVPRIEGPVIPAPNPAALVEKNGPKMPNQSPIPTLKEGEESLTQAQYIENHFRMRDLSIAQIAYMCNMTEKDVTDILVELGYQLPEDLRQ
jgi:hypothetical protein